MPSKMVRFELPSSPVSSVHHTYDTPSNVINPSFVRAAATNHIYDQPSTSMHPVGGYNGYETARSIGSEYNIMGRSTSTSPTHFTPFTNEHSTQTDAAASGGLAKWATPIAVVGVDSLLLAGTGVAIGLIANHNANAASGSGGNVAPTGPDDHIPPYLYGDANNGNRNYSGPDDHIPPFLNDGYNVHSAYIA